MPRQLHRRLIPGAAGKLEALLEPGTGNEGKFAAVICHPHPLYGGDMHNKVVFHIARALGELGVPVLRFNFRGVGMSEGVHANGVGEVEDARAAVDYLATLYPQAGICLAGFSFGATVAMRLGPQDDRVGQLLAVGLPVNLEDFLFLERVKKTKYFIQGAGDEFGDREKLQKLFERLPEPKRLVFIEGAGHFLDGHLEELAAVIRNYFGTG